MCGVSYTHMDIARKQRSNIVVMGLGTEDTHTIPPSSIT
jgi:hypothetical protein